jgi:hypothetical protein
VASIRDLILNVVERKEGNALTSAANDIEKLGRGVDATGGAMRGMENDAKHLNAEIERTNARIKDLHKQFLATGDTSLFGDIRKEEARLRNLQKTFKALTPEFVQAGENIGEILGVSVTNSFTKQVTGAFSGGGEGPSKLAVIGAAVGALIVTSIAPLGAIIAGTVVGAVGTGGIVGGVLAASHDPRVKSAFQAFVQDAQSVFFDAGRSFVDPVLKSLGILDQAVHKLDLNKTFALAAPDLEVITRGLADLVEHTMPGLNKLLERSGPFAHAAAEGFKSIGDALSEFLDNVSSSPGALEGLQLLFASITGTIKGLGAAIKWLSDRYYEFTVIAGGLTDVLSQTLDFIGVHSDFIARGAKNLKDSAAAGEAAANAHKALGYVFRGAAVDAQKLADAIQRENDELANTIDLVSKALGLTLSLDEANNGVARAFIDLGKAISDNGPAWNKHNEAALNLHESFDNAVGALQRMRDAEIASGTSIQQANADYDAGIERLLKLAKQAGATKAQLDALKGTYEVNVIINTIFGALQSGLQPLKNLPHFASGGDVPGPVGAPQLAVVHSGERVLTPSQAAAADAGGGSTTLQIEVGGSPSGPLEAMFVQWMLKILRDHVRFNGGSADVAFS